MKNFSVLLLRPDYATDSYGTDTYFAWVTAEDPRAAVAEARREVFKVDFGEVADCNNQDEDYAILAVLEGHHDLLLSAWDN